MTTIIIINVESMEKKPSRLSLEFTTAPLVVVVVVDDAVGICDEVNDTVGAIVGMLMHDSENCTTFSNGSPTALIIHRAECSLYSPNIATASKNSSQELPIGQVSRFHGTKNK